MSRQIFVNLPIADMERSNAFFTALGFSFNPQFTNEQGACMVIADNIFAMLLVQPFFRTFTKRQPCDTTRQTEGLFALSCGSRGEVDDLVGKAIAAGGSHAMDAKDQGFMYGCSFYDLDGHLGVVLWLVRMVVELGGAKATA